MGLTPFSHIRHPKKRAFLAAYAELGVQTRAARAAHVHRTSVLIWKNQDEEFAAALEVARDLAGDALEDAAIERGRYGIDRPIFHQGKICGKVREYSDTLLIFALKGAKPEKYRERFSAEVTGKDGSPLFTQQNLEAWLRGAPHSD